MEQLIIYYKRVQPVKETSLRKRWKVRKQNSNVCVKLVEDFVIPIVVVELNMAKEEIVQCDWERIDKNIRKILQKNKVEVGDEVYYWYEPELAENLGRRNMDWLEEFLQLVKEQQPFTDTIYVMQENQIDMLSFTKGLVENCNYFVLLTTLPKDLEGWEYEIYKEREQEWEHFVEDSYAEHGLMIRRVSALPAIQRDLRKYYRNEYRPLVLDFVGGDKVDWRNIPPNANYIDFYPTRRKSITITSNCKGVVYTTYANYLDILLKNGYTILV